MPEDDDFHKQHTLAGIPKDFIIISGETPVPKMIGPYKIECLLEKGGMSILYLGTHPETNEPTTIKVLLPRFLSNPDVVQRFLTEAEIIAMTDHPNIVKLYGHGEWEGGLYIAMEYIQGVSLRQTLLQSPISLKRALEIIIDIAYALCHLHTHGVIHRDLKPENILITETGQVKVIDFGIAQLLTEKTSVDAPAKQKLIGTPTYMSPEQRENPENVSYPSDIYSLGIIAYELVLGKLSHGHIHLSLMPKGLHKILNKVLQFQPQDRYQDIVDFITDVSSYLNSTSLHKENKASDQLTEMLENLHLAQEVLVPSKTPNWNDLEIGLSTQKNLGSHGIYFDFFSLPNDSYGILIAETSAKSAEGLIYSALFCGMVQSLKPLADKPIELATMLNTLIHSNEINQIFTVQYLSLFPKENRLQYLTCGYGNLWKIDKAGNTFKIGAHNIAIGINPEIKIIDVSSPWEKGDTLILGTQLPIPSDETMTNEFSEQLFQQMLTELVSTNSQKIVEALLRKIKLSLGKLCQERSPSLICIRRANCTRL